MRVALVGGPSDPAEIVNLTVRQVAVLARGHLLIEDVPGIGKYGELVRVWMTPTPAKDEAEAPKPETMGEG